MLSTGICSLLGWLLMYAGGYTTLAFLAFSPAWQLRSIRNRRFSAIPAGADLTP